MKRLVIARGSDSGSHTYTIMGYIPQHAFSVTALGSFGMGATALLILGVGTVVLRKRRTFLLESRGSSSV